MSSEALLPRMTSTVLLPYLLLVFAFVAGLIRLPTAPPLWWDEGWTLTVARNWVESGHYGRFLAGAPISPRLAAAPSVVLPVALSFHFLGVGAWQGRLPGVVFSALTLWLLYRLTITLYSQRAGVAVLILALFTPMAPNLHPVWIGKQVLGEMPALSFLLAGYLLLFRSLEEGWISKTVGAGLLWSLAVVTKLQVIPFLTLSVAVVVIVLFRQRDWHLLIRYVIPFLTASAAFALWYWFASVQLAALPVVSLNELIKAAFVPVLPPRLGALIATLIWGLPSVISLVYAIRHLGSSPYGLRRLAMWSLATGWFAWYLFLSMGWERYLFPTAFLSLIFFAGLIRDAAIDFRDGSQIGLHFGIVRFQVAWQRLRTRQWRRLTRPQRLATFLLLLAIPISLTSLFSAYLRPDDSVFRLAEYLHAQVPPGALIEAYESEIMFLTDQRYHYPSDELHHALDRRTFLGDRNAKTDYDPLLAGPDYLINGPFSKLYNLYPDDLLAQHFRLERRFGPYDLFRYTGVKKP